MIFWLWLSFLVPVLMTPHAALQAIRPGQPPEGLAASSKTAIIRGKTTNAKTGSPVKDVRVTLRLSGHGEVAGSATSDTNGGYEMRVAPGLYNLSAAKDGFVLTPYLDGANVPVLELGAGRDWDRLLNSLIRFLVTRRIEPTELRS